MKQTARLHVGSVEEMGKRFVDAWRRLERGEKVRETHLTFFDLETMMATLSPKRLALCSSCGYTQKEMWLKAAWILGFRQFAAASVP